MKGNTKNDNLEVGLILSLMPKLRTKELNAENQS